MIPVTYGYARVSESDDAGKNLATQEVELVTYGIRQEHIFTDTASGRTFQRPGWQALMDRVQPGDTIVVVHLDRFSRNFEDGVRIQAELLQRDINIVSLREDIDTTDESPGATFYRRVMLATGALQVETSIERVKAGQARARAEGKHIGRRKALDTNQVLWARRMYEHGQSYRSIGRALGRHKDTVKRAVQGLGSYSD